MDEDSDQTLVFRRADYDDGTRGEIPEDLRTYIPAIRLVRRVEEIVARMTEEAEWNAAARSLAAILLWCLATGRYGSRDMEGLCGEEPLCRHLAVGINPTWADFHRFRRDQEARLHRGLTEILEISRPGMTAVVLSVEVARRLDRARQADREGPV